MAIWLPSAVHPCITRISPAGDIARRDSLRRPLRTRRRKSPVDRMAPGASRPSFTIESEEVVYARYMTMYNRRVVFPSRDGACGDPGAGREVHDFGVVGHPVPIFILWWRSRSTHPMTHLHTGLRAM